MINLRPKKNLVYKLLSATFAGSAIHFALIAGESPEVTEIELLHRASVSSSRIYLSDVAKCSGARSLCREISGIDVAASPAPGRTAFLQRAVVEGVLQKEWSGKEYVVIGAEAARLEASSVEMAVDDVRLKLQAIINERVRSVKDQLRIQILKIQSQTFQVRPTQVSLDFADLAGIAFDDPNWVSKNLIGNRPITLAAYNPNDPDDRTNLPLQVMIGVERNLPVLKKQVAAGQIIAESSIATSWIPMRRGYNDFALTTDLIVGRKAKQTINPGEPIPVRYLEAPMAVGRNQIVKMIVRKGDLEISARATTIDQGAIGQTVQVMNMANKMRMRAKVIDEKTVEAVSF